MYDLRSGITMTCALEHTTYQHSDSYMRSAYTYRPYAVDKRKGQNILRYTVPTAKLYSTKTTNFRLFNLRTKFKNIGNLDGFLPHRFRCQNVVLMLHQHCEISKLSPWKWMSRTSVVFVIWLTFDGLIFIFQLENLYRKWYFYFFSHITAISEWNSDSLTLKIKVKDIDDSAIIQRP